MSVASPQNSESNKLLVSDHPTKVLMRNHQTTFVYIFLKKNHGYSWKKSINFCVVLKKTIDLLSLFECQIY